MEWCTEGMKQSSEMSGVCRLEVLRGWKFHVQFQEMIA